MVSSATPGSLIRESTKALVSSSKVTLGVEWEFLLCFYQPQSEGEQINDLLTAYPGIIIVPGGMSLDNTYQYIIGDVIATLRQGRVDINPSPTGAASQPHRCQDHTAWEKYFRWSLVNDGSVHMPPTWAGPNRSREQQPPPPRPGWVGLELISPALRDEAASYDEIEQVVEMVQASYHVVVHTSCGLHVHTAWGKDPVSLGGLKRCAALLLAIDTVVAELHPRHRQSDNKFAWPVRSESNAAMGWTASEAARAYPEVKDCLFSTWHRDRDPPPSVSIGDAVREIMACTDAGPVAWMMATMTYKGNYDFSPFGDPDCVNPTVEFRQHEGTLDVKRISAWARFCAGLFWYATQELTDDKLFKVVSFCEGAEKDKSGKLYLYELLESFGMTDQARDLGVER